MVRVVCDDTSPLLDVAHCGVAFLLPRTNGELAAPTPSASFDGGVSQLVLHVENGIIETFLLMCGTSAPAREYEYARCERCCAAVAAAGLCCCCCCCCWRTLTPPRVRWCQPGQNNKAPQEIRPAHFAPHARSAQHRRCTGTIPKIPARTRFPRFPRTKTPTLILPQLKKQQTRLGRSPTHPAPHTFSGAR